MKRILLLISCVAVLNFGANAQEMAGDHFVTVGYGILPSIQVFYGSYGLFLSEPTYVNKHVSGALNIQYRYRLLTRLSVSVFAGVENEFGDWYSISNLNDKEDDWEIFYQGKFTRTTYKIGGQLSYDYNCLSDFYAFYGTLGAVKQFLNETDTYLNGVSPSTVKHNTSSISYYISPLGFRFGRRLSGYIEMGLGYKGLFNGGITYRLNKNQKVRTTAD